MSLINEEEALQPAATWRGVRLRQSVAAVRCGHILIIWATMSKGGLKRTAAWRSVMPLSSEHAAMALQMFRKSVASDRTTDRNVSQSWRTRSSRVLAMAMDMVYDEKLWFVRWFMFSVVDQHIHVELWKLQTSLPSPCLFAHDSFVHCSHTILHNSPEERVLGLCNNAVPTDRVPLLTMNFLLIFNPWCLLLAKNTFRYYLTYDVAGDDSPDLLLTVRWWSELAVIILSAELLLSIFNPASVPYLVKSISVKTHSLDSNT